MSYIRGKLYFYNNEYRDKLVAYLNETFSEYSKFKDNPDNDYVYIDMDWVRNSTTSDFFNALTEFIYKAELYATDFDEWGNAKINYRDGDWFWQPEITMYGEEVIYDPKSRIDDNLSGNFELGERWVKSLGTDNILNLIKKENT